MARRLALDAEVLAGLDDSPAEDLSPEPVHDHAAHQRVARIDEPACQAQAIGRLIRGQRVQNPGHAGRNLLALDVVAAANQDVRRSGLWKLLHHHRRRRPNSPPPAS